MEEKKFIKYVKDGYGYWKITASDSGGTNRLLIAKSIAIFYDHKIGKVIYHGYFREVKEQIKVLIENQKKSEDDLGFFLNDYKYYEFDDIVADVLNKIISQKGYFPDNLK